MAPFALSSASVTTHRRGLVCKTRDVLEAGTRCVLWRRSPATGTVGLQLRLRSKMAGYFSRIGSSLLDRLVEAFSNNPR
jgi:hypothetical protein